MVYVISQDSKPLMPCSNPIARLLLKQGKANYYLSKAKQKLRGVSHLQLN